MKHKNIKTLKQEHPLQKYPMGNPLKSHGITWGNHGIHGKAIVFP